jgi:BirA family transcriptional regulator, biotin operon repressor / biotin---[acetyl-CoA-carboxylase] ligase
MIKPTFGQPVFRFDGIDSTMREAAERAEAGSPEGTLVVADRQTAGRGRLGRAWVSEPGVGLYFSLILRPPVPAAQSAVLTLALGLGVARGIGEACGRQCDIRWPNDVLLNEKKCAGILVEMSGGGESVLHAIAGIGINVNHKSLPPELAATATSLRIETGCEYVLETVLAAVLSNTERYYGMFLERGAPAVTDAFARASPVTQLGGRFSGTVTFFRALMKSAAWFDGRARKWADCPQGTKDRSSADG